MDYESKGKTDGLLKGFRALDLTNEQGFTCGKILAALGVDVIKIEQPGGDPSRNIPPFFGDAHDPQKSLYWQAFNTDKRGITLNLQRTKGGSCSKDWPKKLILSWNPSNPVPWNLWVLVMKP